MARYVWGVNQGQTEFSVTASTPALTTDTDVELSIDLTKTYGDATLPTGLRKDDVLRALDFFRNTIIKSNWPPA